MDNTFSTIKLQQIKFTINSMRLTLPWPRCWITDFLASCGQGLHRGCGETFMNGRRRDWRDECSFRINRPA